MPIDIETFEQADEEDLWDGPDLQLEEVFEFLAYNPKQAYARGELQSALELRTIDLLAALSRLEHQGRIRHKGQYWTVVDGHEESREPTERGRPRRLG